MRLSGQVAIVTGASKGLGRVVALALAREGADLILPGRDMAALGCVCDVAREAGRQAEAIATDLRDPASVAAMAAGAGALHDGRVDILVNVAGIAARTPAPIWDQPAEEFDAYFETNVRGPFLTMKHVMPLMIARGRGRVVNIGGTFGFKGIPNNALYAASKWALRGVTKSAAKEAGRFGVTVNLVAPGGIEGESFETWLAEEAGRRGTAVEAEREAFMSGVALRRLSSPKDIARAVLFLASDDAALITGQDLIVDGGTIV